MEESEKEESCGRVWWREEVRWWWGTHWETEGCLGDDILEEGKSRGRGRSRLKYFGQIIGYMGWETFREIKHLAGDRAEWRQLAASNQSLHCVLNDEDDSIWIYAKPFWENRKKYQIANYQTTSSKRVLPVLQF